MIPSHRLKFAATIVAAVLLTPAGAAGPASGPVLQTHRLSAAVTNAMVGTAVRTCAQRGYQVSAVVLDADGVRQAQLRGDGAGIHTLDSAFYKAFTAVTFGVDTITLVEQAKTGPVSSAMGKVPNLLLAQGGVVIKEGQETIGAIGVGGAPGADYDTQCARAAVAEHLAARP